MKVLNVTAGAAALCALGLVCQHAAAAPVTLVDFTKPGHGWHGNHWTRMETAQGSLSFTLTGEDPWAEGPAVAIPGAGQAPKLRITLDAACSNSGECRLFFAAPGENFNEANAVNLQFDPLPAPAYRGIIPLHAPKLRFRIDPPGSSGTFTLRSLSAEALTPLASVDFAPPAPVVFTGEVLAAETADLRILHLSRQWNAFVCYVNGVLMAQSNPDETLFYRHAGRSFALAPGQGDTTSVKTERGFRVTCRIRDDNGAQWNLTREFAVADGALIATTTLQVDEEREMAHLPWLTLFAGIGTFGASKHQALLPGVEYLEDEPSSNEKEIKGAAANRRLVERFMLCYPMMAVTAENRWFSMAWGDTMPEPSPVFDSPDRIFNSGGHLMGLWAPAVGKDRLQGESAVYGTVRLEADRPYTCTVTLRGGRGATVAGVIEEYVQRNALPELPLFAPGFDGAVELLAHGWLESAARDGLRWRHAVFGKRFPPSLAPDVPAYLLWLAANTRNTALKSRLEETAKLAVAELPAGHQGVGGVSHVKLPAGALLYGDLKALVSQAAGRVRGRAASLAANGGYAVYKPAEGKPDYASTLGSDHCNGFTAMTAERMLQDATLTGDRAAIAAALQALDRMTELYAGGVPRGAQPWEMPLHTPDIMASAGMVRCYVLGYLLSGNADYLDQARYWAWTGVSMVYLAPPTEGAIGIYATIGVMGATDWVAPNWIGQPVQWCGLVYRSALEELARVDGQLGDTWRRIARGITIAGMQMTWPADDPENRGGLLPDYLVLKPQERDGPAINPGTVQANLGEAFGRTPMYTLTRLSNGMLAHAPGDLKEEHADNGEIRLTIDAWPETEYRVLLTQAAAAPGAVRWNGKEMKGDYLQEAKALILSLSGDGVLSVH